MHSRRMNVPAVIDAILKAGDGMTQGQLAERLGVSQATISRWKSGDQDPKYAEGQKLEQLAHSLGVFLGTHIELKPRPIAVVGLVGLGEEIEWHGHEAGVSDLGEVDVPFPMPEDCFALEARGDSMMPRVRNGELIVARRNGVTPDEMIGAEAVVKLVDGPYLFKTIRRGYDPDHFNLESFNAGLRENVRIEWAAEVWAIIPARRWRKLIK